MEKLLFTSESVTEGHPDKMCDAISDAILDACMEQDPMSRVACETASCTGFVLVTGEITTKAQLDIPSIVRKTVNEIGYNDAKTGFDGHTCAVMVALDQQSPDIAMGVDKALEAKENKMSDEQLEAIGAGDQGMMFGYATNETPELMPYPISLAHKLALQLTKVRKDGTLKYLRPDGKTQVSVEYDENGKPKRLEAVVLSTQHDEDVTQEQVHEDIKKYVFDPILPTELVDAETKFFINPTGRFVIGGPHKLEDKADKLNEKEQELERLTNDAIKARSVVQPFRNHKVDFTPPRITEKVPLFGTDKWVERQNRHIVKQFTEIVRKIESLYKNDAEQQVKAAQRNVLADYGEFYRLKRENQSLSEINQELESELDTLLSQLAVPSIRNMIFAVADALIGGQPVPISSGGGGSTSDLPWDGRRPDEEEEAYRRKCLLYASRIVKHTKIRSRNR